MSAGSQPEPRRHHYVPRCWLAGFTDTGDQQGNLFVTDLERRKQWGASPGTAGFIRDFYRLEDENASDPVMVEKALSQIEAVVAPILRGIDTEKRSPTVEEVEPLLNFIAIQWVRVPAFRPLVLGVMEKLSDEKLRKKLESPESWRRALKAAGMSPSDPSAGYEEMKEAYEAKAFSLTAPTDWYVRESFKAVESILPGLMKRVWTTRISPSGNFIATDNPVTLGGGAKGMMMGFENAPVISYPVSRHVTIWGTLQAIEYPLMNRYQIAAMNTSTLLRAEGQVFSHVPDFCWLDENRKYQTDWQLFSKSHY